MQLNFRKIPQKLEWHAAYGTVFRAIHGRPPIDSKGEQLARRYAFYFEVLESIGSLRSDRVFVDLGAGLSWFAPMIRAMGPKVHVVDDFGGGGGVDVKNREASIQLLDTMRGVLGIHIVEQELLNTPLPFDDSSIDVITCFHSLEHWHHSPKRLLRDVFRVLKPGGYLFLATPNAVNLRKRISVPLGYTNHCDWTEWHDSDPIFRGHVREPTVGDLQELIRWHGFQLAGIYGRNFIGADTVNLPLLSKSAVKTLVELSDHFLRLFPTLCSDIHVLARK